MPIKVLHVVGAMNMGGTETMLMNVLRNIDSQKIEFHFLSFSEKEAYYDQEIKQLGGKIIHLNKTTSVKCFREVIRKYGPYDVVHSHTLFNSGIANLAASLEGVPIRIAHAHTTLDDSSSLARKLYIQLMQSLIKINSTHYLACSEAAAYYLFGSKSVQSSKYQYLPNMIDYDVLLEPNEEEVLNFKKKYQLEGHLIIGHVGRITEAKNHQFLIEIIDQIKDIRPDALLLLVGDGELREELERVVKEKQLQDYVIFTGIQDSVSSALYNMDIFVFPSLFEGLGLVLLEAQLCSVPCIVSEAIQSEADLKMGLMKSLHLKDGVSKWCETILKQHQRKDMTSEEKMKFLFNQGYTKKQIINQLITIYQGGNR